MIRLSPGFRTLLLVHVVFCASHGSAQAQNVTLTITNNGPNSGAVGVQPGGNVCNPNPGGGGGGAPCVFTYAIGTALRITANSPSTPGAFNSGTGDAASCATSTCNFTINTDSAITATFGGFGPYPALTISLLGDGKGNVGTDNNQCQNFELGFSACTTYYVAGSEVKLQGRSLPGNIFAGFSDGTLNAATCGAPSLPIQPCGFTLSADTTLNATFSALSSVAIEPPSASITVGQNFFFNASATFNNGMTRPGLASQGNWFPHVSMDNARFSLAAAVVGDKLYALGGVDGFCPTSPCVFGPLSTVEAFDPMVTLLAQLNQAWTPRASMATPRGSLAAAAVNGKVYAIGGYTSGGNPVASMEFYDPIGNTWAGRAPMSAARAGMAAAVINNTIYVVGGYGVAVGGGLTPLNTLEVYDPVSDTWALKAATMASARSSPAAAAVNGILYVIGGDGTGSVEAYNPATESWSAKAPMPGGGGSHSAVALNGLIYAVGGPTANVKVYNPASNSWATLAAMQTARGQFGLAVLDGRLFAAGGNLADNTAVATFAAFRPPEATWWSSNTAVGPMNPGNNGSAHGQSTGTATISARLVTINSAPSALLTVTAGGGGGGSTIFLGIPTDPSGGGPATFTEVGEPNWGCGTFGQNAPGPWQVKVNYGESGGVDEIVSYNAPPAPCGGGPDTKGWFSFTHAYTSPGTYQVTVTVRNTATNASTTRSFHIEVDPGECSVVTTNFVKIGSLPFTTVHLAGFERTGTEELFGGDVPFGLLEVGGLPAGSFRIELSVPAGYMVTPSVFYVDPVCGTPITLNATVRLIPVVPPTIVSLTPSETSLWPVNHKYHSISIAAVARSAGGANISGQCSIISATSNEPNTDNDFVITGPLSIDLRAERLGGGSGRIYTITVRCTDGDGLSSTRTALVTVPHSQGKK